MNDMRKLSEILVQSGVKVYRDIVAVVVFSLATSALLLPAVFLLPVAWAAIAVVLLYAPLCVGALHAAHRLLKGEKPKVAHVWAGGVRFYGRGVVFALFCALFALIVISSWWYYGSRDGALYFALAVFQTYFAAMFFASQLYTIPLVVQHDMGIMAAMAKSAKMFVARPGYTIGALFQAACIGICLLFTIVGFAGLFVGIMGIYMNLAAANALKPKEKAPAPGQTAAGQA